MLDRPCQLPTLGRLRPARALLHATRRWQHNLQNVEKCCDRPRNHLAAQWSVFSCRRHLAVATSGEYVQGDVRIRSVDAIADRRAAAENQLPTSGWVNGKAVNPDGADGLQSVRIAENETRDFVMARRRAKRCRTDPTNSWITAVIHEACRVFGCRRSCRFQL